MTTPRFKSASALSMNMKICLLSHMGARSRDLCESKQFCKGKARDRFEPRPALTLRPSPGSWPNRLCYCIFLLDHHVTVGAYVAFQVFVTYHCFRGLQKCSLHFCGFPFLRAFLHFPFIWTFLPFLVLLSCLLPRCLPSFSVTNFTVLRGHFFHFFHCFCSLVFTCCFSSSRCIALLHCFRGVQQCSLYV